MKFFSAFPNFTKKRGNMNTQNFPFDTLLTQTENADSKIPATATVTPENESDIVNSHIKQNDTAATAAYLKFVKSHDNRVNSVKKRN